MPTIKSIISRYEKKKNKKKVEANLYESRSVEII